MHKKYFLISLVLTLLTFQSASAKETKKMDKIIPPQTNELSMKVLTPENLPFTVGSADYFTGSVKVTALIKGEEPSCLQCALVGFQPGARSAWHTHPKGQLLVVTEGSGLIQEWGKPVRKMKKGDVIWTPPNVKHWHGAAPGSAMSHTAVQESQDGKVVEWMEKVTDQEYLSPAQ